jgi:hypothetical protein
VQSAFDWAERNGSGDKHPFWRACDGLVEQHQPFDVVMFPEGVLREDVLTVGDLDQYRTLILPETTSLTSAQAAVVKGFLDRGGRVLATGEVGRNLGDAERATLLGHPHLLRTTDVRAEDFAGGPQVSIPGARTWRSTSTRSATSRRDPRDPLRLRRGARRGPGDPIVHIDVRCSDLSGW